MNPRSIFASPSVFGDTCLRNVFWAAFYVPDLMSKNESYTVQVLRDFVVYHVIWEYIGRTRYVFGGGGITVRLGLQIELSLINLYVLC